MLLSAHLLLLSSERQEFSFINVDSKVGSCSDAGDSYMPESCEEMDGIDGHYLYREKSIFLTRINTWARHSHQLGCALKVPKPTLVGEYIHIKKIDFSAVRVQCTYNIDTLLWQETPILAFTRGSPEHVGTSNLQSRLIPLHTSRCMQFFWIEMETELRSKAVTSAASATSCIGKEPTEGMGHGKSISGKVRG